MRRRGGSSGPRSRGRCLRVTCLGLSCCSRRGKHARKPSRAGGLAAQDGDFALCRLQVAGSSGAGAGVGVASPVITHAPADFDGRTHRQMRILSEKVHDARVAATFFGQHRTLFVTVNVLPLLRPPSLARKYDEHTTALTAAPFAVPSRGKGRAYLKSRLPGGAACGGNPAAPPCCERRRPREDAGMPDEVHRANRAGAMARARAYVESGAFEADLARRVAFKTESQKLPDSLP